MDEMLTSFEVVIRACEHKAPYRTRMMEWAFGPVLLSVEMGDNHFMASSLEEMPVGCREFLVAFCRTVCVADDELKGEINAR